MAVAQTESSRGARGEGAPPEQRPLAKSPPGARAAPRPATLPQPQRESRAEGGKGVKGAWWLSECDRWMFEKRPLSPTLAVDTPPAGLLAAGGEVKDLTTKRKGEKTYGSVRCVFQKVAFLKRLMGLGGGVPQPEIHFQQTFAANAHTYTYTRSRAPGGPGLFRSLTRLPASSVMRCG